MRSRPTAESPATLTTQSEGALIWLCSGGGQIATEEMTYVGNAYLLAYVVSWSDS